MSRILGPSGEVSTDNSTTTPLGSGATFTGTGEQNQYPHLGVMVKTDNTGTLFFDFSNDGTNWDSTFPPTGFSVAANVAEFHTAVKLGRYFRVRFVNDTGAQTFLRLTTYYGENFVPSVAPIGFTIADDADALITKSVISGVGNTTARVTEHQALQVSSPPEGKTAFGEQLAAQLSNELLLDFTYNINSIFIEAQENQSGTVTQSNGMAVCSTGAAANSSALMRSRDRARYQPGYGTRTRFTALFTTGVANSTQIAGIGDESNGFFFGYNGTSFGILHRRDGLPEVRTLTVTTASSTAENITITLDGTAKTNVAVTNTGDTTLTANEIAAADYSDIGRGWTAWAVGSTVVFQSWDANSRTGTYSLSAATTAVGTFAQSVVGAAATETWIPQASWNGLDIFDGNGLTGVTLDPTKGNVFQIDYQWLGFGGIAFYIEDPDDREFHLVHTIHYANANTTPSLSNPTLPIGVFAENTTNTTDLVVKTASMGGFTDGAPAPIGPRRGQDAAVTLGATSAEAPFLTIRSKNVYQGRPNTVTTKLLEVAASADHSKPVEIVFYANATLTGASFTDYDANTSTLEIDTAATAFTGGTLLFSIPLGRQGQIAISLANDRLAGLISAGNSITTTIKPKSGNSAEATVSFNFIELF